MQIVHIYKLRKENIMSPLGKNVSKNIHELYMDNKKSGKARGANGKPRSRAQIIAISLSAAGKSKPMAISKAKAKTMAKAKSKPMTKAKSKPMVKKTVKKAMKKPVRKMK